jgi:predicted neutral ceramidase superfamily lipid hydrolase
LNRNELQTGSLIAAIVGGLGSICLMLMSGLRPPVFLIVLFIGWVSAPFAGLILASKLARRWSSITRSTLYVLMLAISFCSLAIYAYVLVRPPMSQPAFPYVAVPLVSWLVIVITIGLAALISRGRAKTSNNKKSSNNAL